MLCYSHLVSMPKSLVYRERFTASECQQLFGISRSDLSVLNTRPSSSNAPVTDQLTYSVQDVQDVITAKAHRVSQEINFPYWSKWSNSNKPESIPSFDARVIVSQLPPAPAFEISVRGDFLLPMELLYQVMEHLVDSREPGGIRGTSVVVNDLVAISLSCKNLFAASHFGFRYLARKLPAIRLRGRGDGNGDQFVETAARDPRSLSKSELKRLLASLKLIKSGSKDRKFMFIVLLYFSLFYRNDLAAPSRSKYRQADECSNRDSLFTHHGEIRKTR